MIRHGLLTVLLFILPHLALAEWQVSKPESAIPTEPFFQAGKQTNSAMPKTYATPAFPGQYARVGQGAPVYAISISGSVKENLERIMRRYKWRVIWNAPYDYNFDGKVTGADLPNAVRNLLEPFPLQAVMYTSNRTMLVQARNRTQGAN